MANWYPGVMAKTKNELRREIELIDLVIDIRDARLPLTGRAPFLEELAPPEKTLLIASKADLADPALTASWGDYFARRGKNFLALNFLERRCYLPLQKNLLARGKEFNEQRLLRGRGRRDFRVLVAGIPNVGKSTLINSLGGRRRAKASDRAGVTRGIQWVQTPKGLSLLDSPGILTPKLDKETGLLLAAIGSIKEGIFDPLEVACDLLGRLIDLYPLLLSERYNFSPRGMIPYDALEKIGRQRGYLQKGGLVNMGNAAMAFLKDFRSGLLGRITLEKPGGEDFVQ